MWAFSPAVLLTLQNKKKAHGMIFILFVSYDVTLDLLWSS